MRVDVEDTDLFAEAERIYREARRPGTGRIFSASDLDVSPCANLFVCTCETMDALRGSSVQRIGLFDRRTGVFKQVSHGPGSDRGAKFSPDGAKIAFLSDRTEKGSFQLYVLDLASEEIHAAAPVDGWIEYLHWSPDGGRILLGVAGHGSDTAGGAGAIASTRRAAGRPSWAPLVKVGWDAFEWRRALIYGLAGDAFENPWPEGVNIWETCWCGGEALVAVCSDNPGEGSWYRASVRHLHLSTSVMRVIYNPEEQVGWLTASSNGRLISFIEGACSDRGIVSGDVRIVDLAGNRRAALDLGAADVTCIEWRSDQTVLLAGHRMAQSVVWRLNIETMNATERWASADMSSGGRYMNMRGIGTDGDFAFLSESFQQPPEIGVVGNGAYTTIKSFRASGHDAMPYLADAKSIVWTAPDGLNIQGWLLTPRTPGPHPVVMYVHGGPVWHWRPHWLGRSGAAALMLLRRGYAVFYPNPRGSSGRGQDFVRRVYGDIGGLDAQDLHAGLDHLVALGLADPERLVVTGGSYGGFMTAWLVSQSDRFAAAVTLAPHTNQITEELLGNIPEFIQLFLKSSLSTNPRAYLDRSPVMFAHQVKTPTLCVAGALDRCTPPEEAVQFYNAIRGAGGTAALVLYPEEGHGIAKMPAMIDFAARVVGWIEDHL